MVTDHVRPAIARVFNRAPGPLNYRRISPGGESVRARRELWPAPVSSPRHDQHDASPALLHESLHLSPGVIVHALRSRSSTGAPGLLWSAAGARGAKLGRAILTIHDAVEAEPLAFVATGAKGRVSALLMRPAEARGLLVFGHGAGAGMRHRFMEGMSARLAAAGVATLRYQFPYMEAGSRRPDARATLLATVRAAVDCAREAAPDLPLLAGGKSMGGRMTSLAAAEAPLPGVRGLAFFGFPLHPAGRPSTERAEHLARVHLPLLFLQGERDQLAALDLLRPLCAGLGARAILHVIPTADHGFHVLKRAGRSDAEVQDDLARMVVAWAATLS
jgi:uncharacterized protein